MMAHAIDIAGADDGATPRPRSACALGPRTSGCGATRAGDSVARRRGQLRHDRDEDGVQFADDRVGEAAFRKGLLPLAKNCPPVSAKNCRGLTLFCKIKMMGGAPPPVGQVESWSRP